MVPCARRPRTISTRSGKRGLCHIHHGQFATSARCMARAHATHARTHAHAQMRRELHGHLWCSVCGGEHHLARVHQQSVRRVLLYFAEQLQACPPCAMPCHAGQPAQPFPARPPHPAAEQQWRTHCACQRAPAGASLGVRGDAPVKRRVRQCQRHRRAHALVPHRRTRMGTPKRTHSHTHAWACGTHACAHARARSERYAHRSPRLGSVWCRVVGSAGSARAPGTAGFDYLPPFWTPQLCEASCKCLPTASPTDMSTNSLQAPPSSRPSSRPASLPRPGPPSSPPSLPGSPTRLSTLVRKLPVSLPGSPG
jgi:hypothetical protein